MIQTSVSCGFAMSVYFVIVFVAGVFSAQSSCPSPCRCDGTAVDCSHANLEDVNFKLQSWTTELYLQGNRIRQVPLLVLNDVIHLKLINLANNNISEIEDDELEMLMQVDKIILYGNPFHCSCAIISFAELSTVLSNNNDNEPTTNDLVCHTPDSLKGTPLRELMFSSVECGNERSVRSVDVNITDVNITDSTANATAMPADVSATAATPVSGSATISTTSSNGIIASTMTNRMTPNAATSSTTSNATTTPATTSEMTSSAPTSSTVITVITSSSTSNATTIQITSKATSSPATFNATTSPAITMATTSPAVSTETTSGSTFMGTTSSPSTFNVSISSGTTVSSITSSPAISNFTTSNVTTSNGTSFQPTVTTFSEVSQVATKPPMASSPDDTKPPTDDVEESTGLASESIAIIAICTVALVALWLIMIIWFCTKHKKNNEEDAEKHQESVSEAPKKSQDSKPSKGGDTEMTDTQDWGWPSSI